MEASAQVHTAVRMDVRVGRSGRRDDWRSIVPLPEKEIQSPRSLFTALTELSSDSGLRHYAIRMYGKYLDEDVIFDNVQVLMWWFLLMLISDLMVVRNVV